MTSFGQICREKGIPYICDPGQSLSKWDGNSLREWLKGSAALISNDYELEMIMKMTGLTREGILELTEKIITTLGEKGSHIFFPASDLHIPAAKASDVVDPTGAGDAYRAGLLKGMSSGRDIETSAKMGAVAAVYAIEHYGTQEHSYTYEEFVQRYEDNFGEL
jgi:adenosine kinase